MKKFLLLILPCFLAMQGFADNRLYINDFSIDPGATVDVAIMLDNDVNDLASFQADLYLPEDLELVQQYNEDDDEYYTFSLTTRARSRMAIGSSIQSDGTIRLMLSQTMGSTVQTIKDNSGALVTFQIKASESASGTEKINLKNIVFSSANAAQYTFEDTQTTVTIIGESPMDPTGNSFYIEDFSINAGATANVAIMLDNNVDDFASFQADLYLPTGLELVQQYNEDDDEYFTFSLTTRARSRMVIGSSTQSDGAIRLMLSQTLGSSVQTIKDNSGVLVTFQIKALESTSGIKRIDLKNIVFSTASARQCKLEDTSTTVTVNPYSPTSNLVVTANSMNLFTGTSQTLSVYPNTANVTWASSDTSIATISAEGVVTGVKPGSATITCTSNGNTSTPFTVNVLLFGDVNQDGYITITDVTKLVNLILGKQQ